MLPVFYQRASLMHSILQARAQISFHPKASFASAGKSEINIEAGPVYIMGIKLRSILVLCLSASVAVAYNYL